MNSWKIPKINFKKIFFGFLVLISFLVLLWNYYVSPKNSMVEQKPIKNANANNNHYTNKKTYEIQSFENIKNIKKDGSKPGFLSATFYYPKTMTKKKIPVVVVMHGWQGTKEKVTWIAKRTASYGFASIVVTALNSPSLVTKPSEWIVNYENVLASLVAENQELQSPLYHKLDLNNVHLVGHSMGAAGALYYAHNLENSSLPNIVIRSIVALAPYKSIFDSYYPGSRISFPTRIVAGGQDTLVSETMTKSYYQSLPTSTKKDYVFFEKVDHHDFEENGNFHDEIGNIILDWLFRHSSLL